MTEKGETEDNEEESYEEIVKKILIIRFFGIGMLILGILVDLILVIDYNVLILNINFLLWWNLYIICIFIGCIIVVKSMLKAYKIERIIYTKEIKKSILIGFVVIYLTCFFGYVLGMVTLYFYGF